MAEKRRGSARVAGITTTVFSEFSALAAQHGAVNLGQGFPDFDGPESIKEAASRAIRDGVNQYAPATGLPKLREAIAEHAHRFYGMRVDPGTEVCVTSGATEALFDAILALVEPGDEVVVFQPYYDSYVAAVGMAGGTCHYVLLRPPDASHPHWWFDRDELETAFNPRTRLLILNTPNNPTGKVFTVQELELIAESCARHDIVALCDEVYEHLAFAPARHVPLATLPGMRERTVTVSSAGKTFSFTGWKIGWVMAAPPLREAILRAHQFVTFATAAPLQAAAAEALRLGDDYYQGLLADYRLRRDRCVRMLSNAGLPTATPEGTYFALSDIRAYASDDDQFCRYLTREVGVAAIPTSAFYQAQDKGHGRRFARFAFCKTDGVLTAAEQRLSRLRRP